MPVAMDIVFCVDYTSSMLCYFNIVHATIILICTMVLHMQGDIRIGLVKFRSADNPWSTRVHGFTGNIDVLQQWLDDDEPGGVSPDGCEAVGDALNEALNIVRGENIADQILREKVVILITDGAPNGLFTPLIGEDPWIVSNRFIQQGITLVVVGVGESVIECDDFYCALAEKTGGRYIPLVNFERIFDYVMNAVFDGGDTFRRVLQHLNIQEIEKNSSFKYSFMEDRVYGMIIECETMNDIQESFFNHHLSQP